MLVFGHGLLIPTVFLGQLKARNGGLLRALFFGPNGNLLGTLTRMGEVLFVHDFENPIFTLYLCKRKRKGTILEGKTFLFKEMASSEEANRIADGSSQTLPTADVDKQLSPDRNKDFEVDPVSSQVETSNEIKEQNEAAKKKDVLQMLKSAIIVSGIIVAVAGAVFAITKKLKEK